MNTCVYDARFKTIERIHFRKSYKLPYVNFPLRVSAPSSVFLLSYLYNTLLLPDLKERKNITIHSKMTKY